MDIKKAMNRIAWRFGANGNKNPFPVNANDVEAFNQIIKTVNEHQRMQFEHNLILAKLYIFVYMRFISKMGATVLDNEPRKQLHRILEKPIEYWIAQFQKEMNDNEVYQKLEDAGIKIDHPAVLTEEERSSNTEKAKELGTDFLDEVWNFEDTKECLVAEINNVLNKYS